MSVKVTTTFTLDGQAPSDYQKILDYFETHGHENLGWQLIREPLVNRVTAVKTEHVESL